MKKIIISFIVLIVAQFISAQSIVIPEGAFIYVPAGADICAGIYGNISGNIFGEGTQCSNSPVPVELTLFTGIIKNGCVILSWKTETEVNNYGFEVERKNKVSWENITFINGNGNSNSPKEYSYTDKSPLGGSKFQYRLKQIDNDGQFEYSDVVEAELNLTEFVIYQELS